MDKYAITNQKGGVGKTTTAVNFAACLANLGKKVLVADLCHQCNATDHFGHPEPEREEESSWNLLVGKNPDVEALIRPITANLSLIPAHPALAEVDVASMPVVGREKRLRTALSQIESRWDYCVIDCAPSLGVGTVNALTAANTVIITVQTNRFALRGVTRLLKMIEDVKKNVNPELGFYAVATLHRKSVIIHKEILDALRELFGDLALETVIHHTAALAEASEVQQPVVVYASGSTAHQEYQAMTKEILKRAEQRRATKEVFEEAV